MSQTESSNSTGVVRKRRWRDLQSLLNYDFCPGCNRYVYWLKRPVGWLFLAMASSLLLGCFVAQPAIYAAAALAGLMALGIAWPKLAMWGISGSLRWNVPRCEEGQQVEAVLEVVNRWPWPVWGLVLEVEQAAVARGDRPEAAIALCRVSPWSISRFRWDCQPSARGVYPTARPRLTTAFPFGIYRSGRDLEVPQPLIVWPKTFSLPEMPEQSGAASAAFGATSQRTGNEGDWTGVRPYREGDPLRSIHWALSARRDQWVVCERQAPSRREVVVELDARVLDRCEGVQGDRLLHAMASLAKHLLTHSWSVRCIVGSTAVHLHPGGRSWNSWMDALAALPMGSLRNGSEDPHEVATLAVPGAWRIVLTDREPDSDQRQAYLPIDRDVLVLPESEDEGQESEKGFGHWSWRDQTLLDQWQRIVREPAQEGALAWRCVG
jgi:uncharacterized protein (DUF58 family)